MLRERSVANNRPAKYRHWSHVSYISFQGTESGPRPLQLKATVVVDRVGLKCRAVHLNLLVLAAPFGDYCHFGTQELR
jgi:hypothetical protein